MAADNPLLSIKEYFTGRRNAVAEIITINVAAFAVKILLWIGLGYSASSKDLYESIIRHVELPASLTRLLFQPWSLITYMFMHADFGHIAFNMIGLYMFGEILRDYLGNYRVWPVFILGSLAGALAYIAAYNLIPPLREVAPQTYALGASAGIMAVVIGAATLVPDTRVYLLFLGGVPIKFIALFYFLLDLSSLAFGDNFGGHVAHLGGAIFGFVFIKQLQAGIDLSRGLSNFLARPRSVFERKRSRGKVVAMKKSTPLNRNKPTAPNNVSPQERVDQILDKISAKGYNALTEEEKSFLDNFSHRQ